MPTRSPDWPPPEFDNVGRRLRPGGVRRLARRGPPGRRPASPTVATPRTRLAWRAGRSVRGVLDPATRSVPQPGQRHQRRQSSCAVRHRCRGRHCAHDWRPLRPLGRHDRRPDRVGDVLLRQRARPAADRDYPMRSRLRRLARGHQRHPSGSHRPAVVHHHLGDLAGLSWPAHDGDERLSSRRQVSRRLRADYRRQASVRLPHVAAVVPCGRAAGDAVPAAHPHGQLGLRNRAEPHRGQESRRAGRPHHGDAVRLVGPHVRYRRGRGSRAILFDRRQPRRRLGTDRHRDGGDRRHVADRRLRQRARHDVGRVHVRHGERRPVAGWPARLLGQHLPRRRGARRGPDQPHGHRSLRDDPRSARARTTDHRRR